MATGAQKGAFGQLERLAFARPELLKILRIVAIETVVVAIVAPVLQHEIAVFLGRRIFPLVSKCTTTGFVTSWHE
jgi:hypothetical protein